MIAAAVAATGCMAEPGEPGEAPAASEPATSQAEPATSQAAQAEPAAQAADEQPAAGCHQHFEFDATAGNLSDP
ncbi:MAG TPA: hypothetical protein VGC42_32675, partial [Kofleriaceae bacterium]